MVTNQHEKNDYSVGIVGMGFVGQAMRHLFPAAKIFDIDPARSENSQAEINQCAVVFICVPTDGHANGAVDLSAVATVLGWLKAEVIAMKSTVPAEATEKIEALAKSPVVFNPEFLTEKHWRRDIDNETRIILGAHDRAAAKKVARTYQKVCSQEMHYLFTDPKTAMLAKYVGNAFLAVKVTFVNQIFDLCEKLGVDYDELRELWLHDKRVGRSHTLVTQERGFGGYCLPKDLAGLLTTAQEQGIGLPILNSAQEYNNQVRRGG